MPLAQGKQVLWRNLCLSLLIGIVSIKELDALIMPGLDQPFRWALNYLLAYNRNALSDISYSVGPLCLLKWPVAIGDHILISGLFNVLLNTSFVYLFVVFYCRRHETSNIVKPALMAMAYLLLAELDYIFIAIAVTGILHYKFNRDKAGIWLALCFTVIGLYLKTSLVMYLLSIWCMLVIYLLVSKEYKLCFTLLITAFCMYLLSGLLIFRSFQGVSAYSINNLEMAFEYSDSLSLYPYNDWKILGISLLALLSLFVVYLRQPAGFVFLLLGFCIFANWKYAMGREDFWHAITFLYLIALMMVLFIAVQKEKLYMGVFLFIIALSTYTSNLQNLYNYNNYVFWLPDVKNFKDRVLNHKAYKEKLLVDSKYSCRDNILPGDVRKELKDAAVDVFPFDLSYLMVNDLIYQPRPSLQSGIFGVRNDKIDAVHYQSGRAPQYIIWHSLSDGKSQVDGLEGLYFPNTNPATIEAINRCYFPTNYSNERYTIWQKRNSPLKKKETITAVTRVSWGSWVNVPDADSGDIIKAVLKIDYTTKYKLRSLFYKGLPVYVEYKTDSNIYRYRFTKDLAMAGLLAGPLLKDTKGNTEKVRKIRFLNERPGEGYYEGQIQVEWHKIHYQ